MGLCRSERRRWTPARCAKIIVTGVLFFGATLPSPAAPMDEAWNRLRSGEYQLALALALGGRAENPTYEDWHRIEVESLLALGRYSEAHTALLNALDSTRLSIRLRLLGLETARLAGRSEDLEMRLAELRTLVVTQARFVRNLDGLVAIGEAAILFGVEPRLVLENFYKRGREADPPVREAFLATGRLALAKNDDALASRAFQEGIAAFPDDADMWTGLAAAFLDGDRSKLVEYATHALELNPRHATARLLLAEHLIDGEQYKEAREQIDDVLATNPRHPEALAFSAVLAELDNDRALARRLRARALETWAANPAVDHIIGRKLSQKYRFAEGSRHQEAALALDPDFGPAKMQLAQDLLRLGREDEGWKLAAAVHEADGYNVSAYNLVTLRDRLSNFTVLTSPHFRLRMATSEAAIYGKRALDLLEEARATLTVKYGLELNEPVTVEIYPNPKDFAVRTFGMPDNPGFLGVCFGPVVTINSPATRQANWESVLWHEFTHVITLTMTRNRMPRWLSEGISVFEETQREPFWGQRMSLDYRKRILDGRMRPISAMSAAFLESKDGADLQFAYFQSYLAVRHLVERHGFEKLRALLRALGDGTAANDAISATIAPIEELDAGYLAYAAGAARSFGSGLDLRPADDLISSAIARLNPRSFFGRLAEAKSAIEAGDWTAARTHLEAITSTGFHLSGEDNAHLLLARVCRQLSDTPAERAALGTVAEHESAPLEPITRLLELATLAGDEPAAIHWANRWLAINPLAPTPWRALLAACEASGDLSAAAAAGSALLQLDPPDRPAIHFRVARALRETDVEAARLEVLLALEEAPRFREAHQLLLRLPPSSELNSEILAP